MGMQAEHPTARGNGAPTVERNDLTERVDARVGSAGRLHLNRMTRHALRGALEIFLHGALAGLLLETAKIGAVVGQNKPYAVRVGGRAAQVAFSRTHVRTERRGRAGRC